MEETLKWGEPSYLTKSGSTIRMDWKRKSPHQYALYFNCNTSLVDTFKALYRSFFTFEGKRAIVFREADELPGGRSEALCLTRFEVSSLETPAVARRMTSPGGHVALRTASNGQIRPEVNAAMPRNFQQERYNFQGA